MTPIHLIERSVNYDQWAPVRAYRTEAAAEAYLQQCVDHAASYPPGIRWNAPEEEHTRLQEARSQWWDNCPDPDMQPHDDYTLTIINLHDE